MLRKTVLKLEHICKEFPGVVALDNFNLEVRSGEVHVLLGENGAGKSTLIKIISGAVSKTAGTVLIDGCPTEIQNPKHSLDLGIATIYQELNLVPELTVAENIFLGREYMTKWGFIDTGRMFRDAREILSGLGVDIHTERKITDLGIAQQQMVEISKAISMDCRLLILDEPTSALTNQEIQQLFMTIRRLKQNGVGIIYISHRIDEIFEIGDRVTVLRDGKLVGTHDIASVDSEILIQLMVDRKLKDQFPKQKTVKGEESLRVESLSRKGVLKEIYFSLHKGEILGICGLMGSGRTELARAIFGADPIDSGDIFLNGTKVEIKSPRKAIELGIGYLSEDRKLQGLILKLSVAKNISLPNLDAVSSSGMISAQSERQLSEHYLKELQIKATGPDQLVQLLSGGNQQKVVISKWLACHSDILIFDEPTRGIDVAAKVEIYLLMNQLVARGASIIMISSELPEILGMSDRILVMRQGQIRGEFMPENTTQEKLLKCGLGVENVER